MVRSSRVINHYRCWGWRGEPQHGSCPSIPAFEVYRAGPTGDYCAGREGEQYAALEVENHIILPTLILICFRQLWEKKYPEALQKQRVQFLPLDFFESPPVEGSDIYYVSPAEPLASYL
jgi:hypothetical protein